jgi:hypothetical protein
MPAADVIIPFSAMPKLTKRAGWRAAKSVARLATARSAVTTTMRSSSSARSASSSPNTNAGMERSSMRSEERSSRRVVAPSAVPLNTSLVSWAWPSGHRRRGLGGAHAPGPCSSAITCVVVLAGEVADVPVQAHLHHPHALALHRVRHDHRGLALSGRRQVGEGVEDRTEVVPVDPHGPPAEGREAAVDRLDRHDVLGPPVDAELVAVDDGDERGEAVVTCAHRRLPDLAFAQLTVTEHHVRAVVRPSMRAARAMPTPTDRPWPRDPELKSAPGTLRMSGWSPNALPSRV